nr:hypothetical protein [Tanacetum cinerariifolium]
MMLYTDAFNCDRISVSRLRNYAVSLSDRHPTYHETLSDQVKENFNFEVDFEKTKDDPYSRRIDLYKEKFHSEIELLANEYDLRVGMKKYALDGIWEKCERFQDTACQWHDEGFEEEE